MKQIVCLSHSPWKARPNRTQQLLTRLQGVRILFFEPSSQAGDGEHRSGLRVRPNIMVYPLPALRWEDAESRFVRRHNQRRLSAYIQKIMDKHHFVEPVLWCTTPRNVMMVDQLAYRCLVYDCDREWDSLPSEWESELAIAADVVFAASPGLERRLSPCSGNIALLPNGANPLMFLRDDLVPPEFVARLPHPILARVGDVTADLDLEPLLHAARWRAGWTFLLIGRVTRQAQELLAPFSNVVLAGPVAAVELPDHLAGCDAFFDLRSAQRGGDVVPSRIYEYFSTGKPVALMLHPGQDDPFPGAVYPARDIGGFLRCCDAALEEDDHGKRLQRLECARASSWSGRAREVRRILDLIDGA